MTRLDRSPYSFAELAAWRRRLVAHARSLGGDVNDLLAETVVQERAAPNHHVSESASELQASDIDVSAISSDRAELRLVERAVAKIDTGKPSPFGVCEVTGFAIERERLELMPWTPVSAEVGAALERVGLTVEDALQPS